MMNAEERLAVLKRLMQAVYPEGILEDDQKDRKACLARALMAYQMRKDGYTVVAIGKAMGRSHSTVIYLTKNFDSILGAEEEGYYGYFEMVEIWDKFSALVKEHDAGNGGPFPPSLFVKTVGEFRALTDGMPDETEIYLAGGHGPGAIVRSSEYGNAILLGRK